VSHEDFLQEKIFENRPRFFFPHPHPVSQLGAAQGSQAAISAPQLGAALQGSQAAISAPQVGPHGSHASTPQLGPRL
jgi:hypothetical protein